MSFRAIESKAEKARILKEMQNTGDNDADQAEIPIGEANVYLAVFNDGICCVSRRPPNFSNAPTEYSQFHYRDISGMLLTSSVL